ncbi:nuclear transport factor 2 family protein [Flavobacterium sp. UMI-01]|uniref:nuclear transport factor 2 family protein n=1 Tax=Flavobacterium sp. UMI-01 TaxID=1441053 RepID=UPI001C7CAFA8|nr:nuclear transport factor 2 family protein [Flavobacterium sp. UMI-01]GIZ08476.1 ketosteroid isomerase [Flavobacterium sp. UMI-01]
MTTNEPIIHQFFNGLSKADVLSVVSCYDTNIKFRDPIFGLLTGKDVTAMWSMLLENNKENIKIEIVNSKSDAYLGTAQWIASYTFKPSNKTIVNHITTHFHFKEGLIIKQTDDFDIWKWSRQALGCKGFLFGWTGYMQQKIHEKAIQSLQKYKKSISDTPYSNSRI